LYDFTIKHVMTDFIAYSIPNLDDIKNNEHFYTRDYKKVENGKMRMDGPHFVK